MTQPSPFYGRFTEEHDRQTDEDGLAMAAEAKRDPYDPETWGASCARGIRYQDLGSTIDGQKNAVRKMSGGRKKYRGSVMDDLAKQEKRKE